MGIRTTANHRLDLRVIRTPATKPRRGRSKRLRARFTRGADHAAQVARWPDPRHTSTPLPAGALWSGTSVPPAVHRRARCAAAMPGPTAPLSRVIRDSGKRPRRRSSGGGAVSSPALGSACGPTDEWFVVRIRQAAAGTVSTSAGAAVFHATKRRGRPRHGGDVAGPGQRRLA